MKIVGFPTQGEVLQFVFDACGVLPRKHERGESFDEVRKKSTQTTLRRLANEVGQLDPNLGKLLVTFSHLMGGVLPPREFWAFGDVFFDLFDTYRHALKTEGTYLTKSETAKWFLLERAAPRLAISLAKHLQRHNVAADGLLVPEDAFWYLPKRDGNSWQWPLERVMRWAYELAGTSIQRFHCPDDTDLALLGKNLDSAKNWLAGRNLPSWSSLLKNFDESFEALDRCLAKQGLPPLPETQKTSIRTALFLSRTATYISMLVLKHFGDETLQETGRCYRLVSESIVDDTQRVSEFVQQLIAREQLSANEWDTVWFDVVTDYWNKFVARQDLLSQAVASGRITVDEAIDATRTFGRLAALQFEHPENFAPLHSIPDGFGELLLDGLALRKARDLSLSGIEAYRIRLENHGLTETLPWMVPWQRSTYYYREREYSEAYEFIREAYERARYCAGAHQYLLVNQYIELAAKNDNWKEFTQGVHWATYLGIEVRWLRDKSATKENLEFVFEILKRAEYSA
ncbi:hypothetical protein [Paraburkholderia fungorum]|uniref:Uncharacterized protein n=1 Tax=Paraburkholderia fungorum TaxID=134537 RepID=A0A3R7HLC6_9BURK|nr:hypothetical protein [Paraburkholderia fungorum]RKF36713.1 hypothetical protein BCY88_35345 [Paraburkholderia fungorum]